MNPLRLLTTTRRSRRRSLQTANKAGIVGTLVVAACGVLSPEEQLLKQFFEASRLHDTTIVARLSRVAFNPVVDGVVEDFTVGQTTRTGDSAQLDVRAEVRTPDGTSEPRTIRVTLQRQGTRWIIADLRSAP